MIRGPNIHNMEYSFLTWADRMQLTLMRKQTYSEISMSPPVNVCLSPRYHFEITGHNAHSYQEVGFVLCLVKRRTLQLSYQPIDRHRIAAVGRTSIFAEASGSPAIGR